MPAPPGRLPLTTIVVPAHNRWDLTGPCLASIEAHTRAPWEVVLVDDASDAETAALMRAAAGERIRVLREETRRGFAAVNNRAAREARGEYLCLLNNDTLVTPGWLAALVRTVAREPEIGVLGNRHLFPGSRLLHHCGMAFTADGHPEHLHPHTDPDAPAVMRPRDLQIVTFACVLIPRRLYLELGGLDEGFVNGYEDCDFCLRAAGEGRRVAYTPASTIYHVGQATPGRTATDDANRRRFTGKWGGRIRPDFDEITREDRRYNRRRRRQGTPARPGIHFAVDFGEGSAFAWAAAELAAALDDAGEGVSIPAESRIHYGVGRRLARRLRRLRRRAERRTWHLKWSHYRPGHLGRPLRGEVNAEIFCTNFLYDGGGEADPWLRHVRLNGYRKLAVGGFNRGALDDLGVPGERCGTIFLGYAPEAEAVTDRASRGPRGGRDLHLLAVTNSHDPYRYGTDLLVEAVGEAFGRADPVVLHVRDYGAGASPRLVEEWIAGQGDFPRVVWHRRFLEKADLLRLYSRMDVLLAPFRGEGFGMKIIDAMAVGLPVAMPAWGGPLAYAAEGTFLALPHDVVPVGDCLDRRSHPLAAGARWARVRRGEFAALLRSLPGRRDLLEETGAAAREHVRGRFSWPAAARRLMEVLREWEQERLTVVAPRRRAPACEISVVIPTKERPGRLARSLEGYRRQEADRSRFEIIVVNDHGAPEPVSSAVRRAGDALPVRLLESPGAPGPGSARGAGVEAARGEVVLFAGDDVVPGPGLLGAHLDGHRRDGRDCAAVLGWTPWHERLPVTPFMRHICGEGGQQFNYHGLADGARVPFDRFCTANVSVKRSFLVEEEEIFSTAFRHAAYEDVELAYRLHLRGMELRFRRDAVGYHDHPTDPRSFLERQVRTGRMLTVLAYVQPAYVPAAHRGFLDALETLRGRPASESAPAADARDLAEALLVVYEAAQAAAHPAAGGGDRPGREEGLRESLDLESRRIWEALNEVAIRLGMAEEWALGEEERVRARRWAALLALPAALAKAGGRQDAVLWGVADPRRHRRAAHAAALVVRALNAHPRLGPLLRRFEETGAGRAAAGMVRRLIS